MFSVAPHSSRRVRQSCSTGPMLAFVFVLVAARFHGESARVFSCFDGKEDRLRDLLDLQLRGTRDDESILEGTAVWCPDASLECAARASSSTRCERTAMVTGQVRMGPLRQPVSRTQVPASIRSQRAGPTSGAAAIPACSFTKPVRRPTATLRRSCAVCHLADLIRWPRNGVVRARWLVLVMARQPTRRTS